LKEIKMIMKKISLNKPNELIELVGTPISTLGSLTYNYILHKAQFLKTNKVEISASEVFKALEMSEDKEELIKVLITLTENRIISKDSRGKIWGVFNLLSQWEEKEGVFSVHLTEKIYTTVVDQKDLYYTTIQLVEQKSYKCSYSIIFYEIFKKYEKVNIPIFDVEELKDLTGTKLKYKSTYDFKRYILDKALIEINEKNKQYNYSYIEIKVGRKTKEIKFTKSEKNVIDIIETEISDKIKNSILKARKNRYIDTSYSQKAMDKIIQRYDEKDVVKALNELSKYNSEIVNFSKILNSKIKDIIDSKKIKPKKEVIKIVEPKVELLEKSELDLEKERLSLVIFKIDLSTRERIMLFGELSAIQSLESLKKLENKINSMKK
ncbi:MAG: hypothetical protein ACRCZ0_07815, partial [Cetobacterium sp.]